MEISTSILSIKDNLKENIDKLNNLDISYIHLDIMDGLFVKNTTWHAKELIYPLTNNKKSLDVHLMVNDVLSYVDEFKALNPQYITFHYEASCDIMNLISYIKALNIKVGISIKPNTDIKVLDKYLKYIDLVLVMSVEPGMGGQKFLDSAISKIDYLVDIRKKYNYNYKISVDGGINDLTIKKVKSDIAVVGSFITNGNYLENINRLKESIYE